ncbi:MAG: gamma-glutamylcyclotransferase [Burkholderiaceae bacterium]
MNREAVWLFAYGSLIWRPDIPVLAQSLAIAPGWTRRFWQGSHDHRGTPESPGRVVTLIAAPEQHCIGVAYQLDPDVLAGTFDALDHREKNGYERVSIKLNTPAGQALSAVTYLAPPDNFAWLGDAPLEELAEHIAVSQGPSGTNPDYLFGLADALRARNIEDEHVFGLEKAVRGLINRGISHI